MKRVAKMIALLLALCLLAGMLAGCAEQNAPAANGAEEPPATVDAGKETEKEAEKDAGGNGIRIGVCNAYIGNAWRAQMLEGLDLAIEELKAEGLVEDVQVVSTNNDVTEQLSQINAFIADGVDALLINAVSYESLGTVIETAREAGIEVFIFNDPAAYEGTTCITVDGVSIWKVQVQWFMEQFPEGGDIVYLSGIAGNSVDNQRNAIMKEALAQHPEINLLTQAPANWDQAEGQSVMSNLLAAYDKIDGVIGQDGIQEGILRAYENAGVPYPATMLADFVGGFLNKWASDAPDMNCMVATYPPSVGYNALYICAYMMNGRQLKDGVLQPNSLNPDLVNTIYVQTPYIITKDKATGTESWLNGIDISQTELISLEEAIEILDGAPSTTAITKNWSKEIVEDFFVPAN